jgi:hypothetical protein
MDGKIWVESFGEVGGNAPLGWQSNLVTQGSTFYFVIKTPTQKDKSPATQVIYLFGFILRTNSARLE